MQWNSVRNMREMGTKLAALGERWRRRTAPLQRSVAFNLLARLIHEMGDDDVAGVAAEMAYRFLFALFPFLLFLVATLGFLEDLLGVEDLALLVMSSLKTTLPQEVVALVDDDITRLLITQSRTLLTVGIFGAWWGASGGVHNLMKGLNRAYGVVRPRPFWHRQLLALGGTIAIPLFMVAALLLYTFGGNMARWAAELWDSGPLFLRVWIWVRWPALLLTLLLGHVFTYYVLPHVRQRLIAVLPGAVLATATWLLITSGFSLYLANFGRYDVTYGSIGAAIVLLLWMYVLGLSILVGAEVNAVLGTYYGWLVPAKGEKRDEPIQETAPLSPAP